LEIRNINEIEEVYLPEIRKIIKQKQDYYENLFKKYTKDLILEIDFNKDKQYRVNLSLNMISKTVSVTELHNDPVEALRKAFAEFKKAVKKQIAHERKDYLYKRKRYRRQKWNEYFQILTADIEASVKEDKPKYSRKVKNALKSVHKYLKKRLKESGFTKKQIKAQMPQLIDLIERKFYKMFDPKQHGPEDVDALLFGITEEILSQYQNTGAEAEGEMEITEFENGEPAPQEANYEPELYFLEDFSEDENLIEKVNERMNPEQIDNEIEKVIGTLPQNKQAAVHLHFLESFDNEEIGKITGLSGKEINDTITEVKKKVTEVFEKEVN
jgi:DNA-directed RNA polymerase specialized sigma24 family protein